MIDEFGLHPNTQRWWTAFRLAKGQSQYPTQKMMRGGGGGWGEETRYMCVSFFIHHPWIYISLPLYSGLSVGRWEKLSGPYYFGEPVIKIYSAFTALVKRLIRSPCQTNPRIHTKGKGRKVRGQLTGYSIDSLSIITHLEYARSIRSADAPSAAVEPYLGSKKAFVTQNARNYPGCQ